jgi:hypothetical protein
VTILVPHRFEAVWCYAMGPARRSDWACEPRYLRSLRSLAPNDAMTVVMAGIQTTIESVLAEMFTEQPRSSTRSAVVGAWFKHGGRRPALSQN